MTSPSSSHAERTGAMSSKKPATPKLQVQRSLSTEAITIHFSAFGKEEEEEEEEELYGDSSAEELGDQSVVTALEAKEELLFEHDPTTSASVAVLLVASSTLPSSSAAAVPSEFSTFPSVPHVSSTAVAISSPSPAHVISSASLGSSSWPSEHKTATAAVTVSTLSSSSSPSKSATLPFGTPVSTLPSTKPFMSLVKSLTSDVEPKEPTPTLRHRHLMKTLVKSLSTDTYRSDVDSVSYRSPDSRLNLHLFKQFTQPRGTGGDSKTAPSSPLTSPSDGRSSFFKVTEVEAKIEDTKRRLSEVIYEPFQLLSKMMGDESSSSSSSSSKPKALSSSASELSNLASLNGHLENNNNYSIKEEECDSEGECLPGDSLPGRIESSSSLEEQGRDAHPDAKSLLGGGTKNIRMPSSVMEKCSLSELASKEDEEFCELYSEDFDLDFVTESDGLKPEVSSAVARKDGSTDVCSEDEHDVDDEPLPSIPLKTLLALIALVYAYFVLPLPTYVSGLLLGAAVGFMIAIGVVWLVAPRSSARLHKRGKRRGHQWNTAHLDIKEPGIFKGWMNEISSYDPETYHATLTHSVYVRLEGSTLRLSKPNRNISRRASFNESKPDVTYVSQKIYDLTASKIHLVPQSLARKRVWNKKYPICIELGKQDDFMSKAEAGWDREGAEESVEAGGEELKQLLLSQEGGPPAQPPSHRDPTLYLFGRTGREKEEWFRRILLASRLKLEAKKASCLPGNKPGFAPSHGMNNSQSGALTHSRSSSKGSVEDVMSPPKQKELAVNVRQKMLLDYSMFMAKYIPLESSSSPAQSPAHSTDSSPSAASKLPSNPLEDEPEAWVNALLGRIFWDFLREKYWSDIVSKKIQMKLSKIRLPYFMNELTLTELDMGVAVPKILQASKPSIDHQGLWIDLEISYNGSFLMTLETKMNLTRLGKDPVGEGLGRVGEIGKEGVRPRTYCLADSDEESSSAGSSDEEDPPDQPAGDKALALGAEGFVGGHRASKIMRFVDKITKSKYFQKATETEFIKKKIEEVSNTPLLLTVEVQECRGTLAVNIPPPPTDRIWYGFRSPPHLELKARPKLGEREVTFAHVTDWIENKLEREFQKIFVMPNMDDVYVTVMHSALDPRSGVEGEPAKEPSLETAERL